jgi:hypothetical protein
MGEQIIDRSTLEMPGRKGDDSSVDDRDDRRSLFEDPKPRPGEPMDKDDALRNARRHDPKI